MCLSLSMLARRSELLVVCFFSEYCWVFPVYFTSILLPWTHKLRFFFLKLHLLQMNNVCSGNNTFKNNHSRDSFQVVPEPKLFSFLVDAKYIKPWYLSSSHSWTTARLVSILFLILLQFRQGLRIYSKGSYA